MEGLGKIPPHSIEAEQSVLGAMILDIDAITDVTDVVKYDDFYKMAHQQIFSAIIELYDKNEPVDIVTLSEILKKKELLEAIGGVSYLSRISDAGILTSNARSYAEIIEEKSLLRKLIVAAQDILTEGYKADDVANIINMAEQSIFDISQKKNREGLEHIRQVILDAYNRIEKLCEDGGGITGLRTGFSDLDFKTSGLQPSDLILVAARPSMGKTAFAINICQNAATKESASVAIFSLEMSRDQLVQRMLSSEALVPIKNLRNGEMAQNDWINLSKAMAPLSQSNIYIDDTPAITVMEMRAKCRRLKMEKGLDLIMIDYLQLMSGDGKTNSREQEISKISRSLKALAREMKCPVIALSQLSRAPELRADHRPILSDLRESGAIEQDADVVMFLYRDEYYFPESEKKGVGEVIIAKQRNGETGYIELTWLGEFTKFVNKENVFIEPQGI